MTALVLGGTTEGRLLSTRLARAGVPTTACVATPAGADAYGDVPAGLSLHVGRLDRDGFAALLGRGFSIVVDATHPYAVEASENARAACAATGTPYLRVVREASSYEGCIVVDDLPGAVRAIRRPGNVLATTGSAGVRAYTALPDWRERLYVRVLDDAASVAACREAGLAADHVLTGRGPFTLQDNVACIEARSIATLVTKDGGRAGGFDEKVAACRECGVDCVVVARPVAETGVRVEDALAAAILADRGGSPIRDERGATCVSPS